MPVTHHRDFLHKLSVPLLLIRFNGLICILICRQRRTHLKPEPPTTPTPYSHHHSPSQPQGEQESHQIPGSCPGSFKDKKMDATATNWPTQCTVTSQKFAIYLWIFFLPIQMTFVFSLFIFCPEKFPNISSVFKAAFSNCCQPSKIKISVVLSAKCVILKQCKKVLV